MGRFDTSNTVEDINTESSEQEFDVSAARKVIRRGWGNAEKTGRADSPYAQRLKIDEKPVIIKFLEDEPYTSYRMHWVERQGQKSFTCISDLNPKGCPLCDAGHRPSQRIAFNVALLSPGEAPVVRSYEVGPRYMDSLKNFHQDPRQGPLPKHYWAVSRSGKGPTSQTNYQMVRDRDLEEEWGLEPLDAGDIEELGTAVYDNKIVPIPSYKTLHEIASEDLSYEG